MTAKKASEGIALLSMYGDEDDEMEDLDEEDGKSLKEISAPLSDSVDSKDIDDNYVKEITLLQQEERGASSENATPHPSFFSPQQQQQMPVVDLNYVQIGKSRLTIVDYGHEEGAMSPEGEERELVAVDQLVYGELLQTTPGEFGERRSPVASQQPTPNARATPQSLDHPVSDPMDYDVNELEPEETVDDVLVPVDQKDIDPLEKFLQPPPMAKCSEELQEKIIKFLALKAAGRSFNAEVRNRKEYRNPDFLLHAVTYQNIDEIGSCFSKDVFDPHGYEKSDFYDEIEADRIREMERREQERKKSQLQPTNKIPTPKVNIPTAGLSAIASGVSNVTPASLDVPSREGRQNKKSKWDKVDGDGSQENLSTAAIISAAKAGSGYSAFAHQKRKEAEEKRSSDKKSERRS